MYGIISKICKFSIIVLLCAGMLIVEVPVLENRGEISYVQTAYAGVGKLGKKLVVWVAKETAKFLGQSLADAGYASYIESGVREGIDMDKTVNDMIDKRLEKADGVEKLLWAKLLPRAFKHLGEEINNKIDQGKEPSKEDIIATVDETLKNLHANIVKIHGEIVEDSVKAQILEKSLLVVDIADLALDEVVPGIDIATDATAKIMFPGIVDEHGEKKSWSDMAEEIMGPVFKNFDELIAATERRRAEELDELADSTDADKYQQTRIVDSGYENGQITQELRDEFKSIVYDQDAIMKNTVNNYIKIDITQENEEMAEYFKKMQWSDSDKGLGIGEMMHRINNFREKLNEFRQQMYRKYGAKAMQEWDAEYYQNIMRLLDDKLAKLEKLKTLLKQKRDRLSWSEQRAKRETKQQTAYEKAVSRKMNELSKMIKDVTEKDRYTVTSIGRSIDNSNKSVRDDLSNLYKQIKRLIAGDQGRLIYRLEVLLSKSELDEYDTEYLLRHEYQRDLRSFQANLTRLEEQILQLIRAYGRKGPVPSVLYELIDFIRSKLEFLRRLSQALIQLENIIRQDPVVNQKYALLPENMNTLKTKIAYAQTDNNYVIGMLAESPALFNVFFPDAGISEVSVAVGEGDADEPGGGIGPAGGGDDGAGGAVPVEKMKVKDPFGGWRDELLDTNTGKTYRWSGSEGALDIIKKIREIKLGGDRLSWRPPDKADDVLPTPVRWRFPPSRYDSLLRELKDIMGQKRAIMPQKIMPQPKGLPNIQPNLPDFNLGDLNLAQVNANVPGASVTPASVNLVPIFANYSVGDTMTILGTNPFAGLVYRFDVIDHSTTNSHLSTGIFVGSGDNVRFAADAPTQTGLVQNLTSGVNFTGNLDSVTYDATATPNGSCTLNP